MGFERVENVKGYRRTKITNINQAEKCPIAQRNDAIKQKSLVT